jgi:acyl carrier protein
VTTSEETRKDVLATVRAAIGHQAGLDGAAIDPDTPVRAYGLESLHLLRAVAHIEDEIGVAIPDDSLFEELTAGALADIVAALPRRAETP